jgi:hypothetical protein
MTNGGKREGAGRPVGTVKEKTFPAVFMLTSERKAKAKALGQSKWLSSVLDALKDQPKGVKDDKTP